MTRILTTALLAISVCIRGDDDAVYNNPIEQQPDHRSLRVTKTYCPAEYNGKVPVERCTAYVECVDGVQGDDKHHCSPGTVFDIKTSTCNWPDEVTCDPYIAYSSGYQTDAYVNGTNYCPEDYDGRAPVYKCGGYVTCEGGNYTSGFTCPHGTTYDTETQICTSTVTDCDLLVEADETQMIDEMTQMLEAAGTEEERIVYPEKCYGKFTGKLAINQCTGYIFCVNGVEKGVYECVDGLLFDRDMGFCNWEWKVHCASSSPSMKPTPRPTTAAPTPWDPNNVYYPKFDRGICVSDGKHGDVDKKYLFQDIDKCCQTYFPTNFDECSIVTPRPTNSPTKPKPKTWYPVYEEHTCKQDGQHSQYEQNFFISYDECCEFDFMDTEKCLENKPLYYADYDSNTCTNGGTPSEYEELLYTNHSECCLSNEWIDSETCISAGESTLVQHSASASTEMEFYVDYINHKCKCDGKQPSSETTYPTYEVCCDYPWISTEECMKYKHECSTTPIPSFSSLDLWYPDTNSNRCKNDENKPDGVLLWTSYQVCCARIMPDISEECEANSQASMIHKFYPKYFESVCANDGEQSPKETNLYDDIEKCCKNGLYGFDYTTCINDYNNSR